MVVNERGDAAVWVVLGVLRRLLFALLENQVDGLIHEAELLEDERDFPMELCKTMRRQTKTAGSDMEATRVYTSR